QEIIRTSIPIQNKIIHSSDKKKWGSNFKIPLRNSKGEITNLLTINYDVTELKLKEIENRDLERQLFHSQKMESIGRLAGGLAHDFNNILAGIMGYGELLKIHFDNPETMEGKAAEVIYEAAIKASKLTKQLLNFSRKEKHSTAPLNVNTVIINAVKISEKIFEEKVVVETRFCEELNMVEANESQLDQVFTNLLINANDAMPDGGKIILKTENICLDENNLRVLPELTRGNYVKIQVEDFGIGIPAGLKNKVFEPFFSTKIPEKGTGLGLATVYALIKNHKGQIIVESEEGKGTVFTIFLPVSDKRLVEAKKDPQLVKGIGTILMIDDDETILELVEKQFSFLGYKSILASNGKQGLEIYSSMKDEIDLVIIDIIMPEKDGFETFMRLKSINPRVKVIAASGYSKEDKAENLMKAGVLDFIQKPFKLADLSKRIDTILKT
ncbi:MAG: response regulator, partial [bacterium]|nr:response regulator [bacterium]